MSKHQIRQVSEEESLKVAEASRQQEWDKPSFMRELFLGNFRLDLVDPYPLEEEDRPEFTAFFTALHKFLREEVDAVEIDTTGEYPPKVVDGFRKMGAFGMKIPKEYGGLGFTNGEYQRVMELIGTFDGNLVALLSAHQSIGVPQPLKMFGSEEQKKKYLPRCAAGEISAFALTETQVGSDPARLTTSYELSKDGKHYLLNGEKLWCTNGTIAKLLVVMAANPETKKISAFVVEADWKGVKVEHRCHFMGLRALANAVISFKDVKVPVENLIGREGRGLKIALTTLNDGRLSIPSASVGSAKICLKISREWANERVQWGKPIGKHEAISHKIAEMAALTFAMESVSKLATAMADRGDSDIRLEAAAAKEWNTYRTWQVVDETMQIRGGRGYETETSLAARGEEPLGVERMMRDYRINRIFEGSSEIMHLLMAREVFHGMMVHQAKMQNKQAFLFRLVDVGNELFAMTASIGRAQALVRRGDRRGESAVELADLFCRMARRRIRQLFRDLWSNDDVRKYRLALDVLKGRYAWLEEPTVEGTVPATGPQAVPGKKGSEAVPVPAAAMQPVKAAG